MAASNTPTENARCDARDTVVQNGGAGGNFFTIHVATPLEYCEKSDRTGLYAAARRGETANLPGVDIEYESPAKPDLRVDCSVQSVPEIVHSTSTSFCSLVFKVGSNWPSHFSTRHRSLARDKWPYLNKSVTSKFNVLLDATLAIQCFDHRIVFIVL